VEDLHSIIHSSGLTDLSLRRLPRCILKTTHEGWFEIYGKESKNFIKVITACITIGDVREEMLRLIVLAGLD
jgi:hypothetical protein